MFAAAMALIAARALADVREGFRFIADEPCSGP